MSTTIIVRRDLYATHVAASCDGCGERTKFNFQFTGKNGYVTICEFCMGITGTAIATYIRTGETDE